MRNEQMNAVPSAQNGFYIPGIFLAGVELITFHIPASQLGITPDAAEVRCHFKVQRFEFHKGGNDRFAKKKIRNFEHRTGIGRSGIVRWRWAEIVFECARFIGTGIDIIRCAVAVTVICASSRCDA